MPTVLIVDDDVLFRETLLDTLNDYELKVLEASDGLQGLAALDQHPEVDLLILDISMPRMGGIEMARAVRASRPKMPILFLSGDIDRNPEARKLGNACLNKPYREPELADRLRDLGAIGG